jgi:hypothetical protein
MLPVQRQIQFGGRPIRGQPSSQSAAGERAVSRSRIERIADRHRAQRPSGIAQKRLNRILSLEFDTERIATQFTAFRLKSAQTYDPRRAATSLIQNEQQVRGMEITVIARQALLYGHIIVFALALATIIKEDARLVRARRIDSASLHATAKLVKWLLVALWVTGIPMVMMDTGNDVGLLLDKPKILTKLIVVVALTLNGILLHFVAFPMLTGKSQNPNKAATIAATLGAMSTASWLYASFVAVAREVAPYFSLHEFLILYLFVLSIAVSFAIMVVRSRLERLLSVDLVDTSAGQRHDISAMLLEVEDAMLNLRDVHRRLRTEYLAQQFSVRPGTSPGSSVEEPEMTARNRNAPGSASGRPARLQLRWGQR